MSTSQFPTAPSRSHYDVIIIGGATSGSSIAWHLVNDKSFKGSVLVVDRDPSLQFSATTASNNCMRQQFATKINVEIAQYAAEYVKKYGSEFGDDPCVPVPPIRDFGYLYLSDSKNFTKVLQNDQQLQSSLGAGTEILSAHETKRLYPFLHIDDLDSASLNTKDEGCFNAIGMVHWMRANSIKAGVDYINNEVVDITTNGTGDKVESVRLRSGDKISAANVVNAAGTRAAKVAELAKINRIPIEARRRYTYIFSIDESLAQDLPLTIDPTGVHFRSYGAKDYLVGCPPIGPDVAVDVDDFNFEENAWNEKILPVITHRIPQFKTARVTNAWIGHYEFNTFDHNAIIGPHDVLKNFHFCVGFSGHGSQQAPACGRGVAELIVHGEFKSLDLSALSYSRIVDGHPLTERAVI